MTSAEIISLKDRVPPKSEPPPALSTLSWFLDALAFGFGGMADYYAGISSGANSPAVNQTRPSAVLDFQRFRSEFAARKASADKEPDPPPKNNPPGRQRDYLTLKS